MKSFYVSKKLYMKNISLFIFAIISLLGCQKDCLSYEIKRDHPRLVNTEKPLAKGGIIDQLKREAQYYLNTDERKMIVKNKDQMYVRLYSYLYFIDKDEKYFKKAKKLINSLTTAPITKDDQQIRTRLQAFAYYFDLCFDKLKEPEKKKIKEQIVWHINWLDKKNYLWDVNFGGGHQHYANISALIGGVAIYYEEPAIQETVHKLEKNLKEGFQPFFHYLAEEDGGFHMWWEYSRYYIKGILEYFDVWRNATGEDLFVQNPWLNKMGDFLIYGMRDDLTNWGTGDNHARGVGRIEKHIFRKLAAEYNNGHAQYMADRIEKSQKWPDVNDLMVDLLWTDKEIAAQSLDDLPLVKSFNRVGAHVFREGWDTEKDNVMALFKSSPTYFFNHSHRDANHFEIWYKEDLAIDSGFYDAYWSSHWFNYYIRTIAHNTVTIFDPNENIANWDKVESNDGGQKFSPTQYAQPNNVEHLKDGQFSVAKSELLEDNKNYALAVGDATKAYSAQKCKLFKRYFLWLKKVKDWDHPVIVVLDHVISTKPEFEKKWLLHSIHKPEIQDNLITILNGHGKLWNYVIQPQKFEIEVIGGKGREFEVDGVNYPIQKSIHGGVEYAGAWRIELKQRHPQNEVIFLNVLVPTKKNTKKPPFIEAIPHGVRVENWHITFENNQLKIADQTNLSNHASWN